MTKLSPTTVISRLVVHSIQVRMYDIRSQDISLTDNIIGKGAFGEVRVAYWRNIAVAYKRPHLDIVEDSNLT